LKEKHIKYCTKDTTKINTIFYTLNNRIHGSFSIYRDGVIDCLFYYKNNKQHGISTFYRYINNFQYIEAMETYKNDQKNGIYIIFEYKI